MANNYKHSGKRVLINSASGSITAGTLVAQEGFFGVALTSASSGAPFWLAIEGVWYVTVPATTAKGAFIYIPGANGAVTESTGPTPTLTGSNANTPVAKALTAIDSANKAEVLLLAQGAAKAATQV
jgi:predicted RecA/RadA family phage recombinase